MNIESITGIVLAGGRSSRMGTDKSMIRLNDKPLIQYTIDALKPLCSKVVISSNSSIYDFTGCEVWADELPDRAPMIGIYSCLRRSETEVNILLSCDMPLMNTELLAYLLDQSDKHDITVPVHEGNFIEPLCGIYKKSSIGILKEFIDKRNFRLNECIRSASSQLVTVDVQLPFYSPLLFSNINTPDDYRKLQSGQS
ncbi:MAG TPA: molybdenum cofactor guanylyltransferase [Prolixibacteraceae bacterium]|jgi:molybdopterin-guanine dinucleotide biosynthesis protein A